jgi:hypothetical protein
MEFKKLKETANQLPLEPKPKRNFALSRNAKMLRFAALRCLSSRSLAVRTVRFLLIFSFLLVFHIFLFVFLFIFLFVFSSYSLLISLFFLFPLPFLSIFLFPI